MWAAFVPGPKDLVHAFVAASSASRVLDLKVPSAIKPSTFADQAIGLFMNELTTVCSAQECSYARILSRLSLSLKDNALIWWHRRTFTQEKPG